MHFQSECIPVYDSRLFRTTGELSSTWGSDLSTHVFTCVPTSQLRKPLMCMIHIHLLVLHERTGCIAATKLAWMAVVLNGSEASGPLTNSRKFKIIAGRCIKSFEAERGFKWTPLPTDLDTHQHVIHHHLNMSIFYKLSAWHSRHNTLYDTHSFTILPIWYVSNCEPI